MTPDQVIPTYENHGAEWARHRNASLIEKRWLDRFLALAPRPAGAIRFLDIGCGSGRPIASYLADRGAVVTGVDAAKTMVDLFAQTLPAATVIQADMRGLALEGAFDALLAWNSFFHLSAADQRGMFSTFAKHAAPGAALMFTSGHMAGEAIGEVAGQQIYHASLNPDDYRALLADAGFEVIRYTPEDPDCGNHTIWLARFIA